MAPTDTVLVVGATSRLGRQVVHRLRARGQAVRAITRNPAKATDLAASGVEVFQGDLRNPASIERACDGVTYVVGSSHSLFGRGAASPQAVDGAGNRSLVDICKAKGVRHFVYVSAVPVGEGNPIDFFRIKHETEQYIAASGLSYSIVRSASFMETNVDIVGKGFLKNGRIMIFGRGDLRNNYVSVRDVATFILIAIEDDRLHGRTIEVCGPENLSQVEVANIYGRVTGRSAKLRHLPVPMLRLARGVLGVLHPAAKRLLTVGILNATEDMSRDMHGVITEFPIEQTRFEDVIGDWWKSVSSAARA